ncbi:hypothetical protein J8281_02990 [Aquimarina sp. U1-2]|uniref:hypothetical protein n=1 Tax=Aquimarina sp. U1-2 TaxID=2823141 RepID=UPI001AECA820|nr:hypothetical protein [Aquimarina sp. U1-2]MBP2831143.1 hypothetical protein [Aquimarina sp. U1-2]
MKKLVLLLTISLVAIACKQEKSDTDNVEASLIRGEFIFIDGAAVIMGKDFIYGVRINEATKELAKKVAPLQREEYDMVPVVIKGIIKPNDTNGVEKWKEIVEIKEIIGVSAPTSKLPTKINASDVVKNAGDSSVDKEN